MTPSVDANKLVRIVFTTLGLIFALWVGDAVGRGNYVSVFLVISVIAGMVVAAVLRSSVWYLIPVAMGIGGTIPMIPGGFSLQELACLFAFGSFIVLKTVKSISSRPVYDLVDVVLFIVLFQIAITFIRHPVGTLLFDSDRVGGRPYFSILIATLGYWVLSHATINAKWAFRFPAIFTGLTLFGAINGIAAYFFPAVSALAPIHSSFSSEGGENAELGTTRLSFAASLGSNTIKALCSYYRPLSNLNPMRIVRVTLFVLGFLGVAISGFRTGIIGIGMFFFVAQIYWRQLRDICFAFVIGGIIIGGLVITQEHINLPFTIQRSLSFLPGNWDRNAVMEASASIRWRVEMWERMFEDSRYLKNRWLGDGFGTTKETIRSTAGRNRTSQQLQETYLETGAVHSGPFSTIRYVGYIGFALYLFLQVLVGIKAHHIIRRAEKTSYFPLALFFGIPTIIAPFHFTFIFGFYYLSLAGTIINLGLLKMIQNSLKRYMALQAAEAQESLRKENPDGHQVAVSQASP